jgi:hypothetical protein
MLNTLHVEIFLYFGQKGMETWGVDLLDTLQHILATVGRGALVYGGLRCSYTYAFPPRIFDGDGVSVCCFGVSIVAPPSL